jgi:glycosyltransferase involved in cell wall biosynthesis
MSPAKRILLLDTGNEWGGGTNSMFELLKRIDRRRFAITCCFYKDYRQGEAGRRLSEELAAIDIPLILLPPRRQPLSAKLAKEIVRALLWWSSRLKKRALLGIDMAWRIKPRVAALLEILQPDRFDLLYLNNQPSSNLEGYLAGEAAALPVVQHCRIEPTLQAAEAATVNRLATRIICVSQGVADVLAARQIAESRLCVVHNAIDSQAALPPPVVLSPPVADVVIGTVGQLTARKGVMHLLQAVAALAAEELKVTCLILGEGPQRGELEAAASRLGIANRVRFLGFQKAPLAWVQALDIGVLCSRKEGLPRTVLEAMLAGKPVVGSDVTGTRELIVHDETGLLYPYGDIPALTSALRRLIADPQLRRTMGEEGRRRVVDGFSIDAYVAGVSRVLEEAGS